MTSRSTLAIRVNAVVKGGQAAQEHDNEDEQVLPSFSSGYREGWAQTLILTKA